MAKKYEDLKEVIVSDKGTMWTETQLVLNWLDEHPDRVPGRTITERVKVTDTEAYELYQSAKSFSLDDFKLALESIDGIETVDDPVPTNAEKLDADLDDWHAKNKDVRPTLTEHLIERGWVKATGGDE